jgi:short-subunit dehydrogenase
MNGDEKRMKTILITGATAGIGRDAALYLASKGHHVFATGRNQGALDALAREAAEAGLRLETLRLDVTDEASIEAARTHVDAATSGRGLDVLVNNAGYGLMGPIDQISAEDWRAQYDVNVFGLVAMVRAFAPQMRARGAGRIVNVGSIGGRVTFPLMAAYNSTKYAVEAISDGMRMEMGAFGVHVSLIEPGPIETNFATRAMGELDRYRRPDSPYAASLQKAEEIEKTFARFSPGPRVVSKAIEKAIERRRPAARYVTPFGARLMAGSLLALPTRLRDFVMRLSTGLRFGSLLPPAPAPERARLAGEQS